MDSGTSAAFAPSIAPWLTVRDGARAVEFYKSAFEATEVYRLEDPSGGLVVRLSVAGAALIYSTRVLDAVAAKSAK